MKLYKFRCLNNVIDLYRFRDILKNQQLYASNFHDLNDPMEGWFWHQQMPKEQLDNIADGKNNYRICSLSTSWTNIGLWSFYANNGKGVCLEIEVNEQQPHQLVTINYKNRLPQFNNTEWRDNDYYDLFSHKLKLWAFEQEVRVIKKVEGVSNDEDNHVKVRIKSVILGYNMENKCKQKIKDYVEQINIGQTTKNRIHIIQMTHNKLSYRIHRKTWVQSV